MKKATLLAMFLISGLVFSQTYGIPSESPRQTTEQQFSVSSVRIEYGRPGMKGRKIFGELVPYGKIWRLGANSCTKITFGQAVVFGKTTVPPGTYALFAIPNEKEWKFVLNKDFSQWGAYQYDEKLNISELSVSVRKTSERQEWFEITFEPASSDTLNLVFRWDDVETVLPVAISDAATISKIEEKLKEVKKIEFEARKKQ